MVFKRKIDPEKRAYIRLAMQFKGEKPAAIIKKLNISRASFYRILKGENGKKSTKGMATDKYTTGRPRKLSTRDERLLLRQISVLRKSEGNFTVKRIMHSAGINLNTVSCRTVQRFLRRKGFYYLQARKKGILTEKDQYKRLQFARKVKTNYPYSLWTEKIAFYLDGVSFVHKYNPADQARAPKARIWRKKHEGLALGCTSKGSHCGSGGRVAKFMVAISYREGVFLCEQYDRLNGSYFKELIQRKFPNMFKKANKGTSRLWVQDGDPSQNSALARSTWLKIRAKLLTIPPRSPDINPIENIFNIIKQILQKEALNKNITFETFEQFSRRVADRINTLDERLIDRTIESMSRRIDLIIEKSGARTKY